MQKRAVLLLLTLAVLMIATFSTSGAGSLIPDACPEKNTWNGSVDSNWNNAGNWDCGVVPRGTTAVIAAINGAGQPIVNFPVVPDSVVLVSLVDLEVKKDASFDLNGRTLFLSGTLVNNGTLIDTQIIPDPGVFPPTAYFFAVGGYGGLELRRDMGIQNFDPSPVTVRIKGNQFCDDEKATVLRCFDIEPTIKNNVSVDAVFYFAPSELPAGIPCEALLAFHWTGALWEMAGEKGTNNCSSAIYSVSANNIGSFSPFVLSQGTVLAVSVVDFNADAYGREAIMIAAVVFIMGLIFTTGLLTKSGQLFPLQSKERKLAQKIGGFFVDMFTDY
jgi:hypothetical protein